MPSGLIRLLSLGCFLLHIAVSAHVVQAQTCSVQATDIAFGTVDVLVNGNADTTGTVSVSCSGQAHEIVRVCLNIGYPNGSMPDGSSRIALGGTDQLQFQIYSDPGYRQPWGSWQQGSLGGVEIDVQLGADGTAPPVQRMMYGRVFGGQSRVQPTRYVASFSGSQTLYTAQYSRGIPCEALVSGTKRFAFTMSARVPARCSVSAGVMDFGTRGALSTAIDASTNLGIVCSKALPYRVTMDGGQSGTADPTQRRMTNGSDGIIYGLYRNAQRNAPWGETLDADTLAGTGTGLTQSVPVYGRVPAQQTPKPGTYTDTVVVTVIY